MEERLVEIPISVELKEKLGSVVEEEIAKTERQLETLREEKRKMAEENNYCWVLQYLKESHDQIYI